MTNMATNWQEILGLYTDFIETSEDRRSLIRTFLPDMIGEGLNQRQSHGEFRQSSFGINDRDFGRIYRRVEREPNLTDNIRNLGLNDLLDADDFSFRDLNSEERYRYIISFGKIDADSNTFQYGEYGYNTDFIGTKGEVFERIVEDLKQRYQLTDEQIQNVTMKKAFINT